MERFCFVWSSLLALNVQSASKCQSLPQVFQSGSIGFHPSSTGSAGNCQQQKSQYKIPKLNLGFNRGHQITHFEGNQTSSKSMVVLRDFPSKMKCMKFGARCHGVHGPRFIGVKINSSYPSIGIYSRPFIGVSYNSIYHWFLGPPCGETAFHHQELLNLNNAPAAGEPSDNKLSMRSYR